jgi:hypothetical protein
LTSTSSGTASTTSSGRARRLRPTLNYTNLWLDQGPRARIVVFTPADEQSSERLQAIYPSL